MLTALLMASLLIMFLILSTVDDAGDDTQNRKCDAPVDPPQNYLGIPRETARTYLFRCSNT
jgi:hypothetical protein